MADAVAANRLREIVANIERINDELAALQADRKEIYAGAKSEGFDTPTLRKVIARRAKDQDALREMDELLELYEGAISGQMTLPLDREAA
jgi:uncharacterized protein (UPF0335 family)